MRPNGRDIIKDGYQRGLPVAEIARLADSTPGSVRVIASNMGLRHPMLGKIHTRAQMNAGPVVKRIPPYAGYDKHELRWGGRTVTSALTRTES